MMRLYRMGLHVLVGSAVVSILPSPGDTLHPHSALTGSGPHGTTPGRHVFHLPETPVLKLHGPYVHSVMESTANFEWWMSDLARLEIAWGKAPDALDQTLRRNSNRYGNFSLTGLESDQRYYVRLKPDRDFVRADDVECLAEDDSGVLITFQTAATAPTPQVYYVAPDGDDAADGLRRESAWRTVSQAADRVRPGDTVLIGGGIYSESVRIRTTGAPDLPITFRATPGEKVVFDGLDRTLDFGFLALDKSHLHFDGFYFTGFQSGSDNMPWRIDVRSSRMNSHLVLYESHDVQVTRCFSDARGSGYGPGLLHARDCADLVVANNVIIRNMGAGMSIYWHCPRAIIRNNVILIPNITAMGLHLRPRGGNWQSRFDEADRGRFTHNIVTDNLASKVHVPLLSFGWNTHGLHNVFYLRRPADQRVWDPGTNTTFSDMLAEREADDLTRVANPHFQGALDWEQIDADGNPVFLADRLSTRADLDFPDLFATHPELVEHGIGLQPEAFSDFHFTHTNGWDPEQPQDSGRSE